MSITGTPPPQDPRGTVVPAAPPRRRPGRPRGQDSAVVRDAAVRAAVDLIAREGYLATSMAQVAQTAGISTSGLAHHFPSKQALLAAVLQYRDDTDRTPDRPIEDEPWSGFEHLVRLARANMGRRQMVLLYVAITGEATTPEHPAHAWMLVHFRDTLAMLRDSLERDIARGIVRPDAPVERISREMIALMDGLQLQWLLDADLDMSELLAEHLAGLRSRWGLPAEGAHEA
ncbi:TetR/AcrR family transcriptional regulator [Brachybacterium hainanense]|uniref:TetR/AcrR family transcriptional regulator n=1 Tax=Brachybacterium hainanense TaxID=1541174 RepID=A0ABV6RFZ9_9MICO